MNGETAFDQRTRASGSDPSGIVARIQCGNMAAAAEMVECYERNVRRALMRLVPNRADGDDLIQDVWIVALTRIQRRELREPELLVAFLVGTARALAATSAAAASRRATDLDSPAVERYPDDTGEPVEAVEHAQRRQLVLKTISSLRTKQYREVLLRAVADRDKSETCADLHIDAVQYSRLWYKANQRLRQVIGESSSPPWSHRQDSHRP